MIRLKQNCLESCSCELRIIATCITHSETNPKWDLRPYQGAGIGTPNAYWRVWERSGGIEYHRGSIDEDGKLVGLPDEFESDYGYDGYMELQQGCQNRCGSDWDYDGIRWPD